MTIERPSAASTLRVSTLIADGTVILSMAGVVDAATAPMVTGHIANALLARPHTVLLDMRRVDTFTPTGCQALLRSQRTASPARIAIVADQRRCGHGGDECPMPLYASIDEALTAFGRAATG